MRDIDLTTLMTNTPLIHHHKNMRKTSMRLMARYLVADLTTDVILEETISFRNRKIITIIISVIIIIETTIVTITIVGIIVRTTVRTTITADS